MSQSIPPSPQPDPQPPNLESLEQQLRALPQPTVPSGLPAKLIAAVPTTLSAAATAATVSAKLWLWLAGIGAAIVLTTALVIAWLAHVNSIAPPESNATTAANSPALATSKPTPSETAASKAIEKYQQAVQVDPYNADAWFNLAKAQATAHLSADAISSAEKAIDIAHSRNQQGFASTVEAWLKSYRLTPPGQSAK